MTTDIIGRSGLRFNTVNGKRVHATKPMMRLLSMLSFNTVNGKRVHATYTTDFVVKSVEFQYRKR